MHPTLVAMTALLAAQGLLPASADADVICLEAPGPAAFVGLLERASTLLSTTTEAPLSIKVDAAEVAPAPPLGDDEQAPLWCARPDDPRCMPFHAPGGPEASFGSSPLRSVSPPMPPIAPPNAATAAALEHVTRPSEGVRSRVERPPRF